MNLPSPKYALITGASGGIGLEFAKVFASHGHSLILVARSGSKLQEVKNDIEKIYPVHAEILIKDLAKPSAAKELFEEVQMKGWDVEVLVNNAGFGLYGFFADEKLEDELEMLQLNIVTLTELTKRFLVPMRERQSGKILNVASTAAFQPGPMMAVYYATKAYVLSFSEAIANESKGTGISVSCLCPGPTTSDFQKRASINMEIPLFQAARVMNAAAVAHAGYHGLMKRKAVVIPGLTNKLTPLGARLLPRNAVTAIVRYLQETMKSYSKQKAG
jgi:uncharacterized protein